MSMKASELIEVLAQCIQEKGDWFVSVEDNYMVVNCPILRVSYSKDQTKRFVIEYVNPKIL